MVCIGISIRLTRRYNDEIITRQPEWKVKPPAILENKIVCIIDEIADSDKTMTMVKTELKKYNSGRIITASLISHSWAKQKPDYTVLECDELIIFPWDNKVFINGEWKLNPEIAYAIKLQNNKIK